MLRVGAVGGDRDGEDRAGVSGQGGADLLAAGAVPDPGGAVVASGDDLGAVGGDRDGEDRPRVARERRVGGLGRHGHEQQCARIDSCFPDKA